METGRRSRASPNDPKQPGLTLDRIISALESGNITDLWAILSTPYEDLEAFVKNLLREDSGSERLQETFRELYIRYGQTCFYFMLEFFRRCAIVVKSLDNGVADCLEKLLDNYVEWLQSEHLYGETLNRMDGPGPTQEEIEDKLGKWATEERYFNRVDLGIAFLLTRVEDRGKRTKQFLQFAERHCPRTIEDIGHLIIDGRYVDGCYRLQLLGILARRWREFEQSADVIHSPKFWLLIEYLLKSEQAFIDNEQFVFHLFRWLCEGYLKSTTELKEIWGDCIDHIVHMGCFQQCIAEWISQDQFGSPFFKIGRMWLVDGSDDGQDFCRFVRWMLTLTDELDPNVARQCFAAFGDEVTKGQQDRIDQLQERNPDLACALSDLLNRLKATILAQ